MKSRIRNRRSEKTGEGGWGTDRTPSQSATRGGKLPTHVMPSTTICARVGGGSWRSSRLTGWCGQLLGPNDIRSLLKPVQGGQKSRGRHITLQAYLEGIVSLARACQRLFREDLAQSSRIVGFMSFNLLGKSLLLSLLTSLGLALTLLAPLVAAYLFCLGSFLFGLFLLLARR